MTWSDTLNEACLITNSLEYDMLELTIIGRYKMAMQGSSGAKSRKRTEYIVLGLVWIVICRVAWPPLDRVKLVACISKLKPSNLNNDLQF